MNTSEFLELWNELHLFPQYQESFHRSVGKVFVKWWKRKLEIHCLGKNSVDICTETGNSANTAHAVFCFSLIRQKLFQNKIPGVCAEFITPKCNTLKVNIAVKRSSSVRLCFCCFTVEECHTTAVQVSHSSKKLCPYVSCLNTSLDTHYTFTLLPLNRQHTQVWKHSQIMRDL